MQSTACAVLESEEAASKIFAGCVACYRYRNRYRSVGEYLDNDPDPDPDFDFDQAGSCCLART